MYRRQSTGCFKGDDLQPLAWQQELNILHPEVGTSPVGVFSETSGSPAVFVATKIGKKTGNLNQNVIFS